jgi:carbamoyltransferase
MRTSTRQPAVLGLCSFTHDSAAALIAGGRLTGMAEEERLSGVKHTCEYPAAAVQWLLDDAGLTAADVDIVAYNFAGHRYLAGIAGTPGHLLRPATRSRALPRAASFAVIHHRFRQRMETLQGLFPNARVRCVPHHVAHGMYAFAASGFSEAAVLIIDSLGETCTTSIGSGMARPGGDVRYRIRESISDPASLGYAYGAVTAHLGWRRGDEEGTVMALAATGDPARFRDLFACGIRLTPAGFALSPDLFPLRVLRHGWPRVTPAFIDATCPPRGQDEEVTQVHADVAAALQERTEQVMVHLASRAQAVTGARRLCLGGGVAMNCVGIGKILEGGQWDEVQELHESALATVLLLPDRYARAGQMTQRLFEAVLAGCMPITPATLPFASAFTPPTLHAATGEQAADVIADLLSIAGTTRHVALIAECIRMLGTFRLSRQLATINRILGRLTDGSSACLCPRPAAAR